MNQLAAPKIVDHQSSVLDAAAPIDLVAEASTAAGTKDIDTSNQVQGGVAIFDNNQSQFAGSLVPQYV